MQRNYNIKELLVFKETYPNLYQQLVKRGQVGTLCKDMGWDYLIKYASEEEHKEFIIKYECDSITKYQKEYKKSKLKLHSNPHKHFDYASCKEYFGSIFAYKNNRQMLYASEEEHKNFIIKTNSTCAPKYSKVYKTSKLKLHSQPWVLFGYISQKKYFETIFGTKKEYVSEQEHKEFILQTKSDSGYKYSKVYKTSKLKLHSHPNKLFGYSSEKSFFDSIRQQIK